MHIHRTEGGLCGPGGARWLLFGEPRLGGVALVRDPAEGVFDRLLVEHIEIMIVEPFFGFGMGRVVRISGGAEDLVKAGEFRRNPRAARCARRQCRVDRTVRGCRPGYR